MAKTILVVDDNELFRKSLSLLLETNGYEVLEARDGEEALEIYSAYQPPLVITDIHMPHLNGVTLAKQIKAINERTKVIIVSGLPNTKAFFEIAEMFGARRCFEKPVDLNALCTAIAEEFPRGRPTTIGERPE